MYLNFYGNCSLLLIYRPWRDERQSRQFTHISGHPSATGQAQDRQSSPARDWRFTAVPHNQPSQDDLKSPVGWMPVHRDQLWDQCSVTSMGEFYLKKIFYVKYNNILTITEIGFINIVCIGGNVSGLFDRFTKKKPCSRVSLRECQFYSYNSKLAFLSHPLGGGRGLGVTYVIHH